jgi:hypothetical protein
MKFPAERSKGWEVFNEIYLFSLFHILTPKSLFFRTPPTLLPLSQVLIKCCYVTPRKYFIAAGKFKFMPKNNQGFRERASELILISQVR